MKSSLKLNTQHDYVTLKTPNGNFTSSYGGLKFSGQLASNDKATKAITKFYDEKLKKNNVGEVMEMLCNEAVLSSLWPEWNAVQISFEIGDTVKPKAEFFKNKYPMPGVVKEHSGKNYFVKFTDKGTIGFQAFMLEKIK